MSIKKKKVALAFGITKNYVDMLANTLIGLKKHSKKFWDDIIVYNDGISEDDKNGINRILKCTFVEMSNVEFLKNVPQKIIDTYSVATFYRFECFGLLDEYEKVIWNDVDILVQGDLSKILKYGDMSGYAAVYAEERFRVEINFTKLIKKYNMFDRLINAGLLVMSDKLENYKEIQKWCYDSTVEYGSILRWADQAILNLMVQEFNIEVENIDLYQFQCHPSFDKYRNDAIIVHAYGDRKFWNDVEYQLLFPEWYKNHEEWLKIYSHKQCEFIHEYLPLVSVVMSVYNRYKFLNEAVDSILNQTYKNLELIVVVEKSDVQDDICNLLMKYNDDRLIIIRNNVRLGFSNSLNIGIEKSKGKYIARMDDDDISLPNRIFKEVQFMEDNQDVGICDTNAKFFMHEHGLLRKKSMDSEEIKTTLLVSNPICHPSVMIRKSLLKKYNLKYDSEYFSEDYELWSRAAGCFPIAHIDEVLLKYRASKENITSIPENNIKVKDSVKKTIKHQFYDNLGLNLTSDELELLQRQIDVVGNSLCHEEALKWQQDLYKKILDRNKEVGYYRQEYLEKLFNMNHVDEVYKVNIFKRVFKWLFKPFYKAYLYREELIIYNQLIPINMKLDYLMKKSSDCDELKDIDEK